MVDMSTFYEGAGQQVTQVQRWPVSVDTTNPPLVAPMIWRNHSDPPDLLSLPALAIDDCDSRRDSTSTAFSTLPGTPSDLQKPCFSSMYSQIDPLSYPVISDRKNNDINNAHAIDFEEYFHHIPDTTFSHYVPFEGASHNTLTTSAIPSIIGLHKQIPPALPSEGNKRQRLNSQRRHGNQPPKIPPGYPRSLSVSSQALLPSVLVQHPYRRLSSPIGSIRPAMDGDDALDSEDEDGEAGNLTARIPSKVMDRKTIDEGDDTNSQATDDEEYLPIDQLTWMPASTAASIPFKAAPLITQPVHNPSGASVLSCGSHSGALAGIPETLNDEDKPRKQKLRFEGDLYTPLWVKGSAAHKAGFCDMCSPGKWLQLKNSAFWYEIFTS